MSSRAAVAPTVLMALLLATPAGCTSAGNVNGNQPAVRTTPTTRATPSTATPGTAPSTYSKCHHEGDDRTIEQLDDIVAPAVTVPPIRDRNGEVLFGGYTIAEQLVDGGCVIRYDAPGGCLGAVEITEVALPAVTIPGFQSGSTRVEAVTAPAVTLPGARAEQVCQVEEDGRLGTVTRAGVVREGGSRTGIARPGGSVDGIQVPTVRIPPLRVPAVDIEPERLQRRELPGGAGVSVLDGEKTSYVAPAKVLFDTDEAVLRPEGVEALRAIARRIRATSPDARLLVEGHTDDRGDEQYGLDLSERRAETVAGWLAEEGFDRGRITTRGLGETAPVAPNTTDSGRQQNRRVVITVLAH